MGLKVNDSQLLAKSSRTLVLPLMITSSKGFFVCKKVLTGALSVKVADGGDMLLRYLNQWSEGDGGEWERGKA